jgi:hypothetical protein
MEFRERDSVFEESSIFRPQSVKRRHPHVGFVELVPLLSNLAEGVFGCRGIKAAMTRQRRPAEYDRQAAMGWSLGPQIPSLRIVCTAAIKPS